MKNSDADAAEHTTEFSASHGNFDLKASAGRRLRKDMASQKTTELARVGTQVTNHIFGWNAITHQERAPARLTAPRPPSTTGFADEDGSKFRARNAGDHKNGPRIRKRYTTSLSDGNEYRCMLGRLTFDMSGRRRA
jgi:hypothetical protein